MIKIWKKREDIDSKQDMPEIDTDYLREQLADENRRLSRRKLVLRTISVLVVIVAVSVLISTSLMPVLKVYSSSMEPTLKKGNIVVAVRKKTVKTGQLVAFYVGNRTLIKRVIAGPGDWVDMDGNGNVFVNEELLEEPYLTVRDKGESDIKFPYQVPESRYFVLGDNRTVSMDSRSRYIGCISEDQLVGEVILRIWPVGKICIK